MKEHFMIGDDGALYDTRAVNWSSNPLRKNYSFSRRFIETVADVKATLRAGQFAWPGGYPMFFITSDGAALSFAAARSEFYNVASAVNDKIDDGWRIVATEINYEDNDLICDHTGEKIESAYGD